MGKWVKVWWFGAWQRAWCKEVQSGGILAQIADDAPARFFSHGTWIKEGLQ